MLRNSDDLKVEILLEKKKEILKQIIDFELRVKESGAIENLNKGTINLLNKKLKTIDDMINGYSKPIEK